MTGPIVPNIWFNGSADEGVDYYITVFENSHIVNKEYYPTDEKTLLDFQRDLAGKVLTIDFELNGQEFVAINAGSEFTLSEAVSFMIPCKDQEEIDYYWDKLSAVPEAEQCGWCKDKFGLSWQVVPGNFGDALKIPGNYEIMMNQHKIVIAEYNT